MHENNYPTLRGSLDQIVWGEDIRFQMIEKYGTIDFKNAFDLVIHSSKFGNEILDIRDIKGLEFTHDIKSNKELFVNWIQNIIDLNIQNDDANFWIINRHKKFDLHQDIVDKNLV